MNLQRINQWVVCLQIAHTCSLAFGEYTKMFSRLIKVVFLETTFFEFAKLTSQKVILSIDLKFSEIAETISLYYMNRIQIQKSRHYCPKHKKDVISSSQQVKIFWNLTIRKIWNPKMFNIIVSSYYFFCSCCLCLHMFEHL